MPNYCINKLVLDGDNSAILEAIPFILNDEEQVDFSLTLPIPPELDRLAHLTEAGEFTFTRLPEEVYIEQGLSCEVKATILSMINNDVPVVDVIMPRVTKSKLEKILSITDVSWFDLNDDLLSNIERGVAICNSPQVTTKSSDILNALFDIHFQLYSIPYRITQHGTWSNIEWCTNNWGCKWNAMGTTLVGSGYEYIFTTPWSPPDLWFADLSEKLWDAGVYINITLAWCEPGVGFGGELHYTADGESAIIMYTEADMDAFLEEDAKRLSDGAGEFDE